MLENGPASPYAGFFDIAWYDSPRVEMHERLLLPILGKAYGEALESQEIRLQYASRAFTIHYFDHCWPVAPQSYALILEQRRDALATFLGEAPSHWQSTTAFSPLFATCRCAARLIQPE